MPRRNPRLIDALRATLVDRRPPGLVMRLQALAGERRDGRSGRTRSQAPRRDRHAARRRRLRRQPIHPAPRRAGRDPAGARLGRDWYERERDLGARLDHDAAVALALGTEPARGPAPAQIGANPLSKRERQVADARGDWAEQQGDRDRLFVSERTVETHIYNILNKLGLEFQNQDRRRGSCPQDRSTPIISRSRSAGRNASATMSRTSPWSVLRSRRPCDHPPRSTRRSESNGNRAPRQPRLSRPERRRRAGDTAPVALGQRNLYQEASHAFDTHRSTV